MSIIRWNPSVEPFREMEEMMNNLPSTSPAGIKGFVPAVDIYEENNNVVVETPLAGVKPEDVEVSLEKGVLTIQGKSTTEHEVDEKNYYRKEVRGGSFFRQIALPAPVKDDQIKASFEDGILKVTCPKSAPSNAKKINVEIIKKKMKNK